jgi:crotonobetainyl-CoA:carnitine CoA-transferase CaiB-like acyl-CoA transferase
MNVLKGIRVLDLGSYITAPYAAMLLGEMGADVVKVERPGVGDPFRAFQGDLYSSHFQAHNRNKRSIALDYTNPQGLSILDKLVADADVVLINVRPGVEQKMGLGPERLQAINPRLVYCAITGYGADGPYAQRPAFDNVGQALSGWLSMFHHDADPRVPGPAVSDAITGIFAALGILAAIVERNATGRGRLVEVSMLEAMIALATEPLARLASSGQPVPLYARAASSQSFIVTCKDGNRIGLHLSSPEKFWTGLVQATNHLDLYQAFPDRASRVARYDDLAKELQKIFALRDRHEWMALLEQYDVPFAPERRLEELENDPQVQHLDVFYEATHPKYGPIKAANRPVRFDSDNRSDFLPPPSLGEHTEDILREAGLDNAALEELRRANVIA